MKRGKHPTTKRRNKRDSIKERYARAREDAQLEGMLPTEPVGALTPEAVSPTAQSEVDNITLDLEAAKRGWATPEHKKPKIVDRLVEIALDNSSCPKTAVYAARVAGTMDQLQYERDHPEEAGKAKGGGVNVVGVDLKELLQRAEESRRSRVVEQKMLASPEVIEHGRARTGADERGAGASGSDRSTGGEGSGANGTGIRS